MNTPLLSQVLALAITGCHASAADVGPDAAADLGSDLALTLDEPCPRTGISFTSSPATGRELLALLQPSYATTYVPQGVPPGFTWHGSLAPTAVTVGASYAGGAISCGPVLCSCDPPGPCSVARCQEPVLSVVIAQSYVTADGTFNERLTGPLQSTQTARLAFSGKLPATQLQGTYQVSFDSPDRVTMAFGANVNGSSATTGGVVEAAATISGGGGNFQ